jgi:hypothetical protein
MGALPEKDLPGVSLDQSWILEDLSSYMDGTTA